MKVALKIERYSLVFALFLGGFEAMLLGFTLVGFVFFILSGYAFPDDR